MATTNFLNNLMAGNNQAAASGIAQAGKPVIGNNTGALGTVPVSPTTQAAATTKGSAIGSMPTGNTIMANKGGLNAMATPVASTSGDTPTQVPSGSAGITSNPYGSSSSTSTTTSSPGLLDGMSDKAKTKLYDQLKDIYGKGTGDVLYNLMMNLGTGNSAYMQAYEQAMAGPNAENLSTLNTTLGNSGISMDSSTAAIANADFQSNITSQEALVEANLQQQQISQLLSLVQGTQEAAKEQTASSWWDTFSSVLGGAASVGSGLLTGGLAGGLGSLGSVLSGGSSSSGTGATKKSSTSNLAAAQSTASQPNTLETTTSDTSYLGVIPLADESNTPDAGLYL